MSPLSGFIISPVKAYARASGASKCCVQNRNTDVGFSLGSEGRFPKSLIDSRSALRARGCAQNTFCAALAGRVRLPRLR
jgi:hypothetical protein